MADGDRERWNAKWRQRAGELELATPFLVEHAGVLPDRGKALDVAGGAGRNAVWLARRGLDVTLVDVSDVAITRAEQRAAEHRVKLRARLLDLEAPVELAPLYDVVVIWDYLDRARRDDFARLVVEGGYVVAGQPTVKNLERHASPSRRFLIEEGELEAWLAELGFEIIVAREGWTDDGRHEAAVIARRVPTIAPDPEPPSPSEGPYR
jgi:tellurite methyltransferase